MRKALLTIAIAICMAGINAQNIQLFSESGVNVTNQNLTLTDEDELSLHVSNNSSQAMQVAVNFRETSVPVGAESSVCWQYCFENPRPGDDFGSINIAAGETNTNGFHISYFSNGIAEPASYTFTFYNMNNANDTAQITFAYNPNSILEDEKFNWMVFPNPAINNINIDFQGQINEIALRDITGRLLFNRIADKQIINSIDLSNVPNGTYIVEIVALGKICRQKVVVCKK